MLEIYDRSFMVQKRSFNEQVWPMSGRVSLPKNIKPLALLGIMSSLTKMESEFVSTKYAPRLRPRLHHESKSSASNGCAARYRLREDLRRESFWVLSRPPQLKAALDYLCEGDTLAVWKLSRLARSLKQVIKTASDISERGIAFQVLTQNIYTSTPEGRLFFHMTAAYDEFQRELIVENTRAGLKAAAKHGRRGGRSKAMNEQKSNTPKPCLRTPKTTHSSAM